MSFLCFRWMWSSGKGHAAGTGKAMPLPGQSKSEALTLSLVEQHLPLHLPPSTIEVLQPHFRRAGTYPAPRKEWPVAFLRAGDGIGALLA